MSRGALRDYRRGVGRVRRFDVQLPPVRVSARTSLALRTVANRVSAFYNSIAKVDEDDDDHPEWAMESSRPLRASLTPPSHPEPVVVPGEVLPTVSTDDTPPRYADKANVAGRRTGRTRLTR